MKKILITLIAVLILPLFVLTLYAADWNLTVQTDPSNAIVYKVRSDNDFIYYSDFRSVSAWDIATDELAFTTDAMGSSALAMDVCDNYIYYGGSGALWGYNMNTHTHDRTLPTYTGGGALREIICHDGIVYYSGVGGDVNGVNPINNDVVLNITLSTNTLAMAIYDNYIYVTQSSTIRIYNINTGSFIDSISYVGALDVKVTDDYIITGGASQTVRVYDRISHNLLYESPSTGNNVNAVYYYNGLLFYGGDNETVTVLDFQTQQVIETLDYNGIVEDIHINHNRVYVGGNTPRDVKGFDLPFAFDEIDKYFYYNDEPILIEIPPNVFWELWELDKNGHKVRRIKTGNNDIVHFWKNTDEFPFKIQVDGELFFMGYVAHRPENFSQGNFKIGLGSGNIVHNPTDFTNIVHDPNDTLLFHFHHDAGTFNNEVARIHNYTNTSWENLEMPLEELYSLIGNSFIPLPADGSMPMFIDPSLHTWYRTYFNLTTDAVLDYNVPFIYETPMQPHFVRLWGNQMIVATDTGEVNVYLVSDGTIIMSDFYLPPVATVLDFEFQDNWIFSLQDDGSLQYLYSYDLNTHNTYILGELGELNAYSYNVIKNVYGYMIVGNDFGDIHIYNLDWEFESLVQMSVYPITDIIFTHGASFGAVLTDSNVVTITNQWMTQDTGFITLPDTPDSAYIHDNILYVQIDDLIIAFDEDRQQVGSWTIPLSGPAQEFDRIYNNLKVTDDYFYIVAHIPDDDSTYILQFDRFGSIAQTIIGNDTVINDFAILQPDIYGYEGFIELSALSFLKYVVESVDVELSQGILTYGVFREGNFISHGVNILVYDDDSSFININTSHVNIRDGGLFTLSTNIPNVNIRQALNDVSIYDNFTGFDFSGDYSDLFVTNTFQWTVSDNLELETSTIDLSFNFSNGWYGMMNITPAYNFTYQHEYNIFEAIPIIISVEDFMESIGFHSAFGRALVSVLLVTLFAIVMALFKAPAFIIILQSVMMVLLFTAFGWFPAWAMLFTSLVIILIVFNRIKGGGSND